MSEIMTSIKDSEANWDNVIRPRRRWFDIDLRGIWTYRDLLKMYIHRNYVTTYKQTVLGPLWFVIQPVISIVIYMFIFGGLAGISTEGVPQPLFYMAGILMWNYFTECFNASNNVLAKNAEVFGKVYFPRLIIPVAGAVSSLGKLGVQFIMFLVIYLWCISFNSDLSVNWTLLLMPVYFLMIALMGLSLGLLISSFTYKYRDLQMLITYFLQLTMYATPVVYPLEAIPENYRFLVSLNPLTSVFEAFKYGWFNVGTFDWQGLIYSGVWIVVLILASLLIFNRVEQNFMDTV